ncbi:MAG: hypothetical protein AAGK17_14405, partial [Pseudomonadota bacterium]
QKQITARRAELNCVRTVSSEKACPISSSQLIKKDVAKEGPIGSQLSQPIGSGKDAIRIGGVKMQAV